MDLSTFDVVVIGAGPGGYVAAIRASQLGLKVAIVDKNKNPGGTCLNVGCIPSKCLLDASQKYWQAQHHFKEIGIDVGDIKLNLSQMMSHKETVIEDLTRGIAHLFKKNKIHFIHGIAKLLNTHDIEITGEDGKVKTISAKAIIIAAGAAPYALPHLPFDGKEIFSSTEALSFDRVPKHLVIVGGGYIGLEMGSVWLRLGALVTVIEFGDTILAQADDDVRTALQHSLEKQGMIFKTNRNVVGMTKKGKDKELCLQVLDTKAKEGELPDLVTCDAVLVATGRKPDVSALGLEALGISVDERGYINVNHQYQTTIPSIFAIGDCIKGPMLAHKAMDEGVAVAELLAGQAGSVNYDIIPAVVFTHPEIATVGKTENDLKASSCAYKVGKFSFSANGRAKTIGDTTGFVKILTDAKTDRVLGCAIVGAEAGSLISQVAAIMEFGGSAEDIARTCHAHPTLNEAIKEAAWSAFDHAIHS
ncbi:MAG: dihydrolipoyl dehydrogenase [Pseudomonadota bacterium]